MKCLALFIKRTHIIKNYFITFFFHSSSETFTQSAITTLVSFIFIHNTTTTKSTGIHMVLSDAATEKSFTSITTWRSIMLPCCSVSTNSTVCTHPLGGRGGDWHGGGLSQSTHTDFWRIWKIETYFWTLNNCLHISCVRKKIQYTFFMMHRLL